MSPTIISTWIPVILKACESYGQNPVVLLQEAGIDPVLITNPETRVAISHYNRLWRLAVQRTGDSCLGLRVVPFLRPTSFHALGVALMASHSIGEAFERLQRNYPLISDEVRIRIIPDQEITALCFSPDPDAPPPAGASVDAFMAVTMTYARILDDEHLNPVRVEFMHPKPKNPEPFLDFFRAPVLFTAADNRIYFHQHDLKRPLLYANAEIALRNDQIVEDYLVRCRKPRMEDRVRRQIIEQLATGEPTLEMIARSLGKSTRSLNRHLQKEQTSYRMILDSTRRHLAAEYLKQKSLSVLEIAFKLGYADSSNFSRAFKRWFGMSPSQYLLR